MSTQTPRILIVEDDALIARMYKRELEGSGVSVTVSATCESALNHVRNHTCDLILMDIDLGPGATDGVETARRILLDRDVPIVFVTGHTDADVVEQTEAISSYGLVSKGSGPVVLQASVKMALCLHEARQLAQEQERKLRSSEEKFRVAFKTSPDAVNINRLSDGLYVEINDGFTKTTGYTEQDVIGKTSGDIGIWVDLPDRDRLVEGLMDSGVVVNLEARFRMKNGTVIYGSMSARVIELDGESHILSVTRDITESKQRTEALVNSERRFREIVGQATAGYFHVDEHGCYQAVNDAWLRMHGFASDREVIGEHLSMTQTDSDRDKAAELFRHVMNGEAIEAAELGFKRKDGSVGYHTFTSRPLESGGRTVGVEGFLFDVSAKVEAEQELSRTRHLLEAAMRLGKMVAWSADLQTQAITWHGEVHSVLGLAGAPPDTIAAALQLCRAEDKPTLDAAVDHAVQAGEPFNLLLRMATPEGAEKWVRVAGFPVRKEGSVTNGFGMVHDVDEHKRAETALEEQLSEKELLLREVHHRVKNNIASVEALLSLQADSVSHPEAGVALREAMGRVASSRKVYDHLLLGNSHDSVPVRTYLEGLVESILEAFGVGPNLEVMTEIAEISMDPKRLLLLGTVVNEAVTNSVKYAFPSGQGGQLKVLLEDEGANLCLRVCDNGTGLPNGFDMNDPPGLGVMLIGMMAEQLGGKLQIGSSDGTCWIITFSKELPR